MKARHTKFNKNTGTKKVLEVYYTQYPSSLLQWVISYAVHQHN